ncbi:MAG: hypothetical protein CFE34_20210 [Rhodobacteraceae bacterium PARR1]|nr:MAG: hypothetical protein CFE34_20210 [Rhodobacteraceae bacterium PARR1]
MIVPVETHPVAEAPAKPAKAPRAPKPAVQADLALDTPVAEAKPAPKPRAPRKPKVDKPEGSDGGNGQAAAE